LDEWELRIGLKRFRELRRGSNVRDEGGQQRVKGFRVWEHMIGFRDQRVGAEDGVRGLGMRELWRGCKVLGEGVRF
jgi:hypothetical protein